MKSGPSLLLVALLFVVAVALVAILRVDGDGSALRIDSAAATPDASTANLLRPDEDRAGDAPTVRDHERAQVPVTARPVASAAEPDAFDPSALVASVVDEDDAPIAGADVTLFEGRAPLDLAPAIGRATTDAEGRLRVDDLEAFRTYRVWIVAEGFVSLLEAHQPGIDTVFELARAATLEGRVVEAGRGTPLAGVKVTTRRDHWVGETFGRYVSTTTDEAGEFRLTGLAYGETLPLALCRANTVPVERELQLDDAPRTSCELALRAVSQCLGRVLEASDRTPIAGAEVRVDEHVVATSDATGSIAFAFEGTVGDVPAVEAFAAGRCVTRVVLQEGHVDGSLPLELLMLRGGTIRGVVRGDDGRPLAGVRVHPSNRNRRPQELAVPHWMTFSGPRASFQVSTGADGRFEVAPIVTGQRSIRLHATHPNYGKTFADVSLSSLDQVAEVELTLVTGGTLTGVVTVGGAPVSASVTFRSVQERSSTRSNDRGDYQLVGLRPGEGHVSAQVEGSWRYTQGDRGDAVWIAAGETTRHDIEISSEALRVSGRVTDTSGLPVADQTVYAFHRDPIERRYVGGNAETEADGRYEIALASESGLEFQVVTRRGPSRAAVDGVFPPARGVDLVLPVLVELWLEVTDAASGHPVVTFDVHWRADGTGELFELEADDHAANAEGLVRLELPAGAHDIAIDARGSGYCVQRVERVPVDGRSTAPLAVRLVRGTSLTIDVAGAPQTPGWLALVPEPDVAAGVWKALETRSAFVDAGGRIQVRGVAPGNYQLVGPPHAGDRSSDKLRVPIDVPPQEVVVLAVEWPADADTTNGAGSDDTRRTLKALGYLGD